MPINSPLLLDTHVWIWLMNGDERLRNTKALQLIHQASSHDQLKVSIISVWEIGLLARKKRILLPRHPLIWVREALSQPGLTLAPLTEDVAVESSFLPGEMVGDPADRILVATARALKATFVTADEKIQRYATQNRIMIVAV